PRRILYPAHTPIRKPPQRGRCPMMRTARSARTITLCVVWAILPYSARAQGSLDDYRRAATVGQRLAGLTVDIAQPPTWTEPRRRRPPVFPQAVLRVAEVAAAEPVESAAAQRPAHPASRPTDGPRRSFKTSTWRRAPRARRLPAVRAVAAAVAVAPDAAGQTP